MDLEIGFISIEHAVEPRKELLGAVVGMQDDRNAIGRGDGADVVGSSDGASDGCLLVSVAYTLWESVYTKWPHRGRGTTFPAK